MAGRLTRVREFLGDSGTKYLFHLSDQETHISPTTIGNEVKKNTLRNVGEGVYFKAMVHDYAARGRAKDLATLSKRRGTDVETIISTYLKD